MILLILQEAINIGSIHPATMIVKIMCHLTFKWQYVPSNTMLTKLSYDSRYVNTITDYIEISYIRQTLRAKLGCLYLAI